MDRPIAGIAGIAKARTRTSGGFGAIALAAAAATVAGHELAYRFTYFEGHDRYAAMARAGHSYWPGAVRAAAVLAVVGVILQIARGLTAGLSEPPRTRSVVAHLVPTQVGLFALMEMVERTVEGDSPLVFLTQRTFWVGLLAQFVLAIVVAIVLRAARKAGRALHALLSKAVVPPRENRWGPRETRSFSTAYRGSSRRPRAPPARAALAR